MRQLAILILALPLFAQTTASLTGTVTSQGGQPIPGVTVIATSASLQGMRSAITGETGMYTFDALPPGSYRLKFEQGGMVAEESAGVPLSPTPPRGRGGEGGVGELGHPHTPPPPPAPPGP